MATLKVLTNWPSRSSICKRTMRILAGLPFILARAAIQMGKSDEARFHFEYAIILAHDPRTLAWSHIYLGRIFDIQANRQKALRHYRAALEAGDPTPDTKTAAEKGLAGPFQGAGSLHK